MSDMFWDAIKEDRKEQELNKKAQQLYKLLNDMSQAQREYVFTPTQEKVKTIIATVSSMKGNVRVLRNERVEVPITLSEIAKLEEHYTSRAYQGVLDETAFYVGLFTGTSKDGITGHDCYHTALFKTMFQYTSRMIAFVDVTSTSPRYSGTREELVSRLESKVSIASMRQFETLPSVSAADVEDMARKTGLKRHYQIPQRTHR